MVPIRAPLSCSGKVRQGLVSGTFFAGKEIDPHPGIRVAGFFAHPSRACLAGQKMGQRGQVGSRRATMEAIEGDRTIHWINPPGNLPQQVARSSSFVMRRLSSRPAATISS